MPTHSAPLSNPAGEIYPAAYVQTRLSWRGQFRDLSALIDSGADQSMIPKLLAQVLQLPKVSEVYVEDANGGLKCQDVFVVDVEFHGFAVQALPVAATDSSMILIGRDVLSTLVTEIDGPGGTFSLRS